MFQTTNQMEFINPLYNWGAPHCTIPYASVSLDEKHSDPSVEHDEAPDVRRVHGVWSHKNPAVMAQNTSCKY